MYNAQPAPPRLTSADASASNAATAMLLQYLMGTSYAPTSAAQSSALSNGQGPLNSAAATDWDSSTKLSMLDPMGGANLFSSLQTNPLQAGNTTNYTGGYQLGTPPPPTVNHNSTD